MYEDSWYSFVPEANHHSRKPSIAQPQSNHRRRESLLQQSNDHTKVPEIKPLSRVYEEIEDPDTPPEPTIVRRAASYADFYDIVRQHVLAEGEQKKRKKTKRSDRSLDALLVLAQNDLKPEQDDSEDDFEDALRDQVLEVGQAAYTLYSDQLALAVRHLDNLVEDASSTVQLLTSLSNSFQAVDTQTTSFRAECEDLLTEQRRLEKLSAEVDSDLHYYAYLETATRRLNAPGASKMVDDTEFGEMIDNLDACIDFMRKHENYRDRDTYLTRYEALLTKALHLLEHGLTSRLQKILPDISRQITATKSESARHALAYGRFEEMILDTWNLVPNIRKVTRRTFDQYGRANQSDQDTSIFCTAASNLFTTYLTVRDQYLKLLTQHDLQEFQKDIKTLSVETAVRNLIKQFYERIYHEDTLFQKIFNIEPVWSKVTTSAYTILKGINTTMAHPGNITPLATNVQTTLQTAGLEAICSIVGWLANEFSFADIDEEESAFQYKCREYTGRLLVEHLWPFTDVSFEAEITKSITKGTVEDASLKINPVEKGVSSSNAYPLTKRAIELLVMFDQAMPKERSSKNSPVVFKIVRETIQVLQRAEARIKSIKVGTDPDLFMVKNLLILKNELVSLEIGDITSADQSMQHFTQIWDALTPSNWVSLVGSILSGPASLWSRSTPTVTAKSLTVEDMSEQLDDLLRQSIYAFTKRWAALINDSTARKAGVKPIAKVERDLETCLDTAFSNQPEVISKLKEAIEMSAQAQIDALKEKQGSKR